MKKLPTILMTSACLAGFCVPAHAQAQADVDLLGTDLEDLLVLEST